MKKCDLKLVETSNTQITLPANDLDPNDMHLCNMNEGILINNNSDKKIIITDGVATCLVIIIHHPQSKLTLFSHIDSSKDIVETQNRFIAPFNTEEIPLQELHVYLAGGWRSFFESEQAASLLKKYWSKTEVILHTDLLLSRDGIAIEEHEDFLNFMDKCLLEIDCPREGILPQEYQDFMEKFISNGVLYSKDRTKTKNYPANKRDSYLAIETAIEKLVKFFLGKKEICTREYFKKNELLMVQYTHNPMNETQKRIVIGFDDGYTAALRLVGFNLVSNELFISTDNCASLMNIMRFRAVQKPTVMVCGVAMFDGREGDSSSFKELSVAQLKLSPPKMKHTSQHTFWQESEQDMQEEEAIGNIKQPTNMPSSS